MKASFISFSRNLLITGASKQRSFAVGGEVRLGFKIRGFVKSFCDIAKNRRSHRYFRPTVSCGAIRRLARERADVNGSTENVGLKENDKEGFHCLGLSNWTIYSLLSQFCCLNFQTFSLL